MIIDDKGRLFGKISIIDLFAAAVLIMVVLVVYVGLGLGSRPVVTGASQPVQITFFVPALQDFTVNAIEMGARVENDTDGTFMGRVTNIEIGESISFMPDINGREVSSPMEGHSSVTLTSVVDGQLVDGMLLLEGNLYGSGTTIIIWVGKAKMMLQISDITPMSQLGGQA